MTIFWIIWYLAMHNSIRLKNSYWLPSDSYILSVTFDLVWGDQIRHWHLSPPNFPSFMVRQSESGKVVVEAVSERPRRGLCVWGVKVVSERLRQGQKWRTIYNCHSVVGSCFLTVCYCALPSTIWFRKWSYHVSGAIHYDYRVVHQPNCIK